MEEAQACSKPGPAGSKHPACRVLEGVALSWPAAAIKGTKYERQAPAARRYL